MQQIQAELLLSCGAQEFSRIRVRLHICHFSIVLTTLTIDMINSIPFWEVLPRNRSSLTGFYNRLEKSRVVAHIASQPIQDVGPQFSQLYEAQEATN